LEDRKVAVAFRFASGDVFAGTADLTDGVVWFQPNSDWLADFVDHWATGSRVTLVTAQGYEFPFSLNGTRAALEALTRCYEDHLDGSADPFGEPAPSPGNLF